MFGHTFQHSSPDTRAHSLQGGPIQTHLSGADPSPMPQELACDPVYTNQNSHPSGW